jgi:hypothetical protein
MKHLDPRSFAFAFVLSMGGLPLPATIIVGCSSPECSPEGSCDGDACVDDSSCLIPPGCKGAACNQAEGVGFCEPYGCTAHDQGGAS